MIVSVIGLGYIGLPTAAVLASKGIKVIGVDNNEHVVDVVNQGKVHIVEPGLDLLVRNSVSNKYLMATTEIMESDVFIVAVPTPFKGNYEPDLSYIKSAAKMISRVLAKGNIVILESTSPVGATEKMLEWMSEDRQDLSFPRFGEKGCNSDVFISHCPERVLPGKVVQELIENDRIIGGVTTCCANKAKEVYQTFVQAECLVTDCRTAELSKLVENSFRDVNIAFANELSLICDELNINVWNLIEMANRHPRVNILQPGPGVGGHCIAVDPWFIVDSSPNVSKLIRTARMVNDNKPNFVVNKVREAAGEAARDISDVKVACLGLSFKPDIDDLRESPALKIAHEIEGMGFSRVFLVEPNIDQMPESFDSEKSELVSESQAIKDADIVVLLVDHTSFKAIDFSLLSEKCIIDTRGVWRE